MRLVFLLMILVTVKSHADAGAIADLLGLVETTFPESKAACVANVYKSEVNPGVQSSTVDYYSIQQLSEKRLKQPCFSTLARRFYDNVQKQDRKFTDSSSSSLMDEAGAGIYKSLRPSWVWENAIEYSGGNSVLAMRLANICLSDNLPVEYDGVTRYSEGEKAAALSKIQEKLARLNSAKNKDPDWTQEIIPKLEVQQASLQSTSEDLHPYTLKCPNRKSTAYVSGSLHPSTTLPTETREAILDIYDRKKFPDKQYHTYAAAAIGCSLAKCNISETEVRLFQSQAAALYRGIRLCGFIKTAQKWRNILKERNALVPKNLKALLENQNENKEAIQNLKYANICTVSMQSCPVYSDPLPSDDRFVNLISSSIDAAELFESGQIIKSLPCTFGNYSGPKLQSEDILPGTFIDRLWYKNGCRKNGWNQSRCDEAAKRLRSWEVDELWTRAQQERGAIFGFNQCKGQKDQSDDNIELQACKAIQNGSLGTKSNAAEVTR